MEILRDIGVNFINNKKVQDLGRWFLKSGMSGEYLNGPVLNKARKDTYVNVQGTGVLLGPGIGTDILFVPSGVKEIIALDMDPKAECKEIAKKAGIKYDLRTADFSKQETFSNLKDLDFAISSFALCLTPNPEEILGFIYKTLRPGGTLCLVEHGVNHADSDSQLKFASSWANMAHGCDLMNDWEALVKEAGFKINYLEKRKINLPEIVPFQNPLYCIQAVK